MWNILEEHGPKDAHLPRCDAEYKDETTLRRVLPKSRQVERRPITAAGGGGGGSRKWGNLEIWKGDTVGF